MIPRAISIKINGPGGGEKCVSNENENALCGEKYSKLEVDV